MSKQKITVNHLWIPVDIKTLYSLKISCLRHLKMKTLHNCLRIAEKFENVATKFSAEEGLVTVEFANYFARPGGGKGRRASR